MHRPPDMRRPRPIHQSSEAHFRNRHGNYTPHPQSFGAWKQKQQPAFRDGWRDRLPSPGAYYPEHLNKLTKPNGACWAMALCPFHEDSAPSLAVNMEHGGFRCHACGASGDLVAFHCRLTGLSFKAALSDLGADHG